MNKGVKKNKSSFEKGFTLGALNLSIPSNNFQVVGNFFGKFLKESGKLGNGFLAFEGLWDDTKSLFVGTNSKLGINIVHFNGNEGLKLFEIFRKDFINLEVNKEIVESIKVSKVQAVFVQDVPITINSQKDVETAFEEVITTQQKNVPKTSISNGSLLIGGKTGSLNLEITPLVEADLSVKKMVTVLSTKDQMSDQIWSAIVSSITVTFKAILAWLILHQYSRVTLTEFLKNLRTRYMKDFDVGKVVSFAQKKQKATTSHGKYVLRALAGVKNKLTKAETSEETKELFLNWMEELHEKHSTKIPEFNVFVTSIRQVGNQNAQQIGMNPLELDSASLESPPAGRKRTRKSVDEV